MDYIKIRFGNDLDPLDSSFKRTIEDIFRPRPANPMFRSCERSWSPQMDIYEGPEDIIVIAEVAGVDKDSLDVEINNRAVRISGMRPEPPRVAETTYRLAEIQYGRFERILYLPEPIDTGKVSSTYANGFLMIRLTKTPTSKPRSIPITEG